MGLRTTVFYSEQPIAFILVPDFPSDVREALSNEDTASFLTSETTGEDLTT
jgi:hypothetical protein